MTGHATSRCPSDRQIALALFMGTVVLVGVTAGSIGFTRDEGIYFRAAESYFRWFRAVMAALLAGHPGTAFERSVIDQYWSYNHEHPVLMKTLFGLSWGLLKAGLGLFSLHSTAFRFPAFLMAGLSVALTYLLARQFLGRTASLSAALMWLSLPRPFWNMHLACFDVPVCVAHLAIVYAYVRGRHTVRGGEAQCAPHPSGALHPLGPGCGAQPSAGRCISAASGSAKGVHCHGGPWADRVCRPLALPVA
jgi:4-amino-4-deoxy-L-arabinose transferase-like glycosyltransferase